MIAFAARFAGACFSCLPPCPARPQRRATDALVLSSKTASRSEMVIGLLQQWWMIAATIEQQACNKWPLLTMRALMNSNEARGCLLLTADWVVELKLRESQLHAFV